MTPFQLAALFLTLVAAVGWANARWLKLPSGVAMVLAGAAIPAAAPLLDRIPGAPAHWLTETAAGVNFPEAVMGYMLAFLLFAGATQVDLSEMLRRRWSVTTLATLGVAASTVVVGFGLWAVARALKLDLPLPWALAFGALISPTDPIAVLATVKSGSLSLRLRTVLQGEALFNDGVGIVVFNAAAAFLVGHPPDALPTVGRVVVEALGGLAVGWAGGALVIRLMRAIDDHAVEVSLTLALAAGAYALAEALHLSGPIAAVTAGLLIGGPQAECAMSETTQRYVAGFWTLVDEILNALLFLMLGLQLLVTPFEPAGLGLWIAAIALVTVTRGAVVAPWGVYFRGRGDRGATRLLAWGGLHGALSLALALSLPPGPARALVLSTTFAVVLFSVVVQGLTFAPLSRRLAQGERVQGGAQP